MVRIDAVRALFVSALALCCASFAAAADLLVPKQYPTIQSAINASVNGDTVIVSDGTYPELIRFFGKAITLRSASGAATTIIDGGQLGTTVKFANAETAASVLDGFTIRNGRAAVGGGMYINSANPTIRNCVFANNTALDRGAGVAVVNGRPSFASCAFNDNTATERGGAAYLMVNSDVAWTSCVFTGNRAMNRSGDSYGGAVAAESLSDQTFAGCTFTSNKAEPDSGYNGGAQGGAVWLNNTVGAFADCTFNANSANPRNSDGYGGAICALTAAPAIQRCVFTNDRVQQLNPQSYNGHGGAVYMSAAGLFADNSFTACSVTGFYDARGGAAHCGSDGTFSSSVFANCLISGSSYAYGGAVYSGGNGAFANSGFATCSINSSGYAYGGAAYCGGAGGYANCSFTACSASGGANVRGGAVGGSSASTSGCMFTGNASQRGGAVYTDGTFSSSGTQFRQNQAVYEGGSIRCGQVGTITDSLFESNRCVGEGNAYGGAIRCVSGNNSGPLTNVQFIGNYAQAASGHEAAGGAIWGYAFQQLTNCEFRSNYASGTNAYGGAMWCYGGSWTGCTFASNLATTPAGTALGGAVRIERGYTEQANFTNCTFTNNNTDGNSTVGGGIYR